MAKIRKHYTERTPADYLEQIEPSILNSLTSHQRSEVSRVLSCAIPKPSPKIVDLRFTIDLILGRFFFVIWIGKDRRKSARYYPQTPITRMGNFITACFLLFSLNLTLTLSLFLTGYLFKTLMGINLLPGHLQDYVQTAF